MENYQIKTMQKDLEKLQQESGANQPPEELPVESSGPPITPSSLPDIPSEAELFKKPEKEESSISLPPFPAEPSEKIKAKKPRFGFIVLIVAIILILGGGFYYWWNYLKVSQKTEPEIPVSLISVDKTDVIEIKNFDENILIEKLQTSFSKKENEGSLRRILIKKIEKKQDYFVSLEKLCEVLGIKVPIDVSSNFEKDYTLFFYSQKQGNRTGLITKIVNADALKVSLGNWESSMRQDLEPIFLGQQLGQQATSIFQNNTYREAQIRYLNFSDPSLTLDYVLVGDYLIITTSKDSMHGVIDRVLGE